MTFHSKRALLWPFNVAGNNKIKVPSMKFTEIRGSRADTDMSKVIGAFRDYANASKNQPQNEWKIVASQSLLKM
jgi:hypothetical protein